MDALTDNIGRVRSRIVQSPDRIKRSIITMGSTAAEDKRTVAMNEAKIRDLQAKINALLNIEKDVRSCVEGLRSIEKETRALEEHKKELSDFKEQLSKKTADYNDFVSKRDVSHIQTHYPLCTFLITISIASKHANVQSRRENGLCTETRC